MEERKWPGPKGMIPEPDRNAADANMHNRRYLDQLLVEMRIIDAVEPDLTLDLFGKKFSSPIMMPAFSHLNKVGITGRTPMQEYALAAKEMNLVNWVGMEPDEEYASIAEQGAETVRIIKPFKDHDEIFRQIAFAKQHGALAVGVDIDHVFGKNGKYDVVDGIELGPVMFEDLCAYVKAAGDTPFVAKGVLSVYDAEKCERAGCAGIFISHHHGRLPFGIPPVIALREITEAIPETAMKLFVDCSIESGYDAFKALALGADAVSVGRGILPGLLKEGTDGVISKVKKMNEELSEMMGYTGIRDLDEMDPSVIYKL
ncbi:MAG TPA: FMN-dependent dehydrogenase [Erysipelotrichaceae bacterium]|nr:FMN-dependent dehydrogenase [Erysipelotrichaceae bacterium]